MSNFFVAASVLGEKAWEMLGVFFFVCKEWGTFTYFPVSVNLKTLRCSLTSESLVVKNILNIFFQSEIYTIYSSVH